jgi:hypothetical protein
VVKHQNFFRTQISKRNELTKMYLLFQTFIPCLRRNDISKWLKIPAA